MSLHYSIHASKFFIFLYHEKVLMKVLQLCLDSPIEALNFKSGVQCTFSMDGSIYFVYPWLKW